MLGIVNCSRAQTRKLTSVSAGDGLRLPSIWEVATLYYGSSGNAKMFYQTIKPSEWQKLDIVSSEVAHQVVSLGAVFFYCISMVFLPCKCSYILLCNLISLKNVKWNLKSDGKTHIFQQDKGPPLISYHWTYIGHDIYGAGNPGLDIVRAKNLHSD